MYLFDTNALSELAVRRPHPLVHGRFFQTAAHLRFSSFVVLQELRYGTSLHPQPEMVWQKVEREILPFVRWLSSTNRRPSERVISRPNSNGPAASLTWKTSKLPPRP